MFELIIDTTDKCFMNCKYCGTNSKHNGVSFLDHNKIIEMLSATKKVYKDHIIFLGGGCFFCHPNWEKILEANKNIKANIRIDVPLHTSLSSYINKYSPLEYNYNVSLSLWGINDLQNNLSGVISFYMFNELISTINKYQKEKYLSFVITKELINQQNEIVDFINKFNDDTYIYFHRLMPTGRSSSRLLPSLTSIRLFCNKIEEKNKSGIKLNFHHTIFSNICKAYKDRLFINHDGKVYGCGWIDSKTKHIKDINKENLSMADILMDLRKYNENKNNKCAFF